MIEGQTSTAFDLAPWRKQVAAHPVMAKIIAAEPFQRLWRISFLGAIDYLTPGKPAEGVRSRACHSLDVAALAAFVAEQRSYSGEQALHLVCAALLHDIGHMPLSHSVEPLLRQWFGQGHHELGERVMEGDAPGSADLSEILKNNFDLPQLKALIAGQSEELRGADLFASPINVDTIDGIWRTVRTVKGHPPPLRRIDVAVAAFLESDDHSLLDAFWQLKDKVYRNVIHGRSGIVADAYARHYLQGRRTQVEESWLYETEPVWRQRFRELFGALRRLPGRTPELPGQEIGYTAREYRIEFRQRGMARYRVTRRPTTLSLSHQTVAAPC